MDVSIVSDQHRIRVKRSLMQAITHGSEILTKEARLQIVEEELNKMIADVAKRKDDDEDNDF